MKAKYCLVLLIFTFISCREEFIINVDNEVDEVINLVAELSSEEAVDLTLLRNVAIGSDIFDAEISNAKISFSSVENPDFVKNMLYDPSSRKYVLEDEDYRIEGGQAYTLDIEVPNEEGGMTHITAETKVPQKVSADLILVGNKEEIETAEGTIYSARVEVSLNDPQDLPAFFQVVPYRRMAQIFRDNNGDFIPVDLDGRVAMDVKQIVEDRHGVTTLTHKQGVYVDHSRLGENRIVMDVQSERPLIYPEVIRTIEIDVITLSKDLYHYNVDLDKEIRSLQSSYTYPVSLYSNINNGQGVFGGAVFTTEDGRW